METLRLFTTYFSFSFLFFSFFFSLGFPCGSAGKESARNESDLGSIPGLGRSPGEGKGYPLQYSGLENSMGLQRVRLSNFHLHFLFTDKKNAEARVGLVYEGGKGGHLQRLKGRSLTRSEAGLQTVFLGPATSLPGIDTVLLSRVWPPPVKS